MNVKVDVTREDLVFSISLTIDGKTTDHKGTPFRWAIMLNDGNVWRDSVMPVGSAASFFDDPCLGATDTNLLKVLRDYGLGRYGPDGAVQVRRKVSKALHNACLEYLQFDLNDLDELRSGEHESDDDRLQSTRESLEAEHERIDSSLTTDPDTPYTGDDLFNVDERVEAQSKADQLVVNEKYDKHAIEICFAHARRAKRDRMCDYARAAILIARAYALKGGRTDAHEFISSIDGIEIPQTKKDSSQVLAPIKENYLYVLYDEIIVRGEGHLLPITNFGEFVHAKNAALEVHQRELVNA